MRTNRLGRTSLVVTELGFGAAPLGNMFTEMSDDNAVATVEAAWRGGVRYFDTAPHYGLGLSETRLGRALAEHRRSEFVVSTKVGRLLVPNDAPTGTDLASGGFAVPDRLKREWDFSADGVRRSLDASLARLGLDRVDIVLVHDPDDFLEPAMSKAIPALIAVREQGVIGAVGVGMNQWQAPLRIVQETDIDVVMLADRWTLLDRTGQPLLDACAAAGVSVLAAGPFNSGLLARPWPADDATFEYAPATAELLERARTFASALSNASLPQVALQWPLRHPAVASVVAGMRTAEEAATNTGLVERAVPPTTWDALDEVAGQLR